MLIKYVYIYTIWENKKITLNVILKINNYDNIFDIYIQDVRDYPPKPLCAGRGR